MLTAKIHHASVLTQSMERAAEIPLRLDRLFPLEQQQLQRFYNAPKSHTQEVFRG